MTGPEPALQNLSGAPLLAALRQAIWPWLEQSAKWLTRIYVIGLVLLLVWLETEGERLSLSGILLFAPPQILLLPLCLLTPLCLVARWRSVLWHLVAVVLVAFGYMKFRWHPSAEQQPADLTVVTHNTGQGNRAQFYEFLAAQDPDVIVMQDAKARGAEFARKYPDRHVAGAGEFLLVSRVPIVQSEPVAQPTANGRPIAARFELLWRDRPLIIYNVHLPTPRRQLSPLLSARALAQIFADEESARIPMSYSQWTAGRLRLARELAEVFRRERLPFLVFGDFNTPDHGLIYHSFTKQLTDAHLVGGSGWGLTFPGATRNPLSAHGPWLRIDYAFAGRGWEPTWCMPEPGRRSQHCAVVARFVSKSS